MNNLYYEDLNDRRLWIDGDSTYHKEGLCDKMLSGEELSESDITHVSDSDMRKFSKLTGIKLQTKDSPDYSKINDSFIIPDKFLNLDLEQYFIDKIKKRYNQISELDLESRIARMYDELRLYKEIGLTDVLRLAIYIVSEFKEHNIVWGPGRGSSCCSYLLYLIELHDVDSVYFNLHIDEFLRK